MAQQPSIMRTIQIDDRPTKLAQAVAELGRIDKTIHSLTCCGYIADLRRFRGWLRGRPPGKDSRVCAASALFRSRELPPAPHPLGKAARRQREPQGSQFEIYCLIVQRTQRFLPSGPNLEQRFLAFRCHYAWTASLFKWTFTRRDPRTLSGRIADTRPDSPRLNRNNSER
jgi:hypothetical protein